GARSVHAEQRGDALEVPASDLGPLGERARLIVLGREDAHEVHRGALAADERPDDGEDAVRQLRAVERHEDAIERGLHEGVLETRSGVGAWWRTSSATEP